jgi:hypothetical protein
MNGGELGCSEEPLTDEWFDRAEQGRPDQLGLYFIETISKFVTILILFNAAYFTIILRVLCMKLLSEIDIRL